MIELISTERCISCGLCVKVCPTNVFDEDGSGTPFIARQEDCQTCFMCEAYCPVDAMYVAPFADDSVTVDEDELADNGLLGSWRATIGWGPGRTRLASIDQTLFLRRFRQQGGQGQQPGPAQTAEAAESQQSGESQEAAQSPGR